MKSLALFVVLLAYSIFSLAQSKKIFKINPGEKVYATIPKADIYSYPQFIIGTVQFRANTVGSALMNYNSLLGEMEFINDKGDTLTLDDPITINYITIAEDTFFYDKGYVRQLMHAGPINLAIKKLISFSNRQKLGGFGEVAASGVDSYNSLTSPTNLKEMVAREILSFTEYKTYYFGDKFNHFVAASKKSLINLLPNKQVELEAYLKEHPVNFTKEEDLLLLMNFLQTI